MSRYKDSGAVPRSVSLFRKKPSSSESEVLRLIQALKETNSRLEREVEKSGNLQRELRAKEAETARMKEQIARDVMDPSTDASWKEKYAAAMVRIDELESAVSSAPSSAVARERLPDDRLGKIYKLRIGVDQRLCPECKMPLPGSRVSGHLTLNRYPDGRLGEMFLALDRARRGDLAATFAHQFAIMVSMALQYHVPPEVIIARLRHVRDESGGYVIHEIDGKLTPEEHTVGSLIDLIAVRMEQFCNQEGPT